MINTQRYNVQHTINLWNSRHLTLCTPELTPRTYRLIFVVLHFFFSKHLVLHACLHLTDVQLIIFKSNHKPRNVSVNHPLYVPCSCSCSFAGVSHHSLTRNMAASGGSSQCRVRWQSRKKLCQLVTLSRDEWQLRVVVIVKGLLITATWPYSMCWGRKGAVDVPERSNRGNEFHVCWGRQISILAAAVSGQRRPGSRRQHVPVRRLHSQHQCTIFLGLETKREKTGSAISLKQVNIDTHRNHSCVISPPHQWCCDITIRGRNISCTTGEKLYHRHVQPIPQKPMPTVLISEEPGSLQHPRVKK